MQRSIKLGHCICNPKKGCPCDVFKEKDICPCAGERVEESIEDVRLTSLVEKAGCASKINQNDLKKVLSGLPEVTDPNVLVGTNTCDDAGIYKLDEETALVQTVDVFTPSVDDPYTFGQIAAANSLSDVYAMGGRPLTALSIIGFPIEALSHRVMTQMLRGGMDKMSEAGVPIVGGHSINDKDPKFGYSVTGVIHPRRIVANSGARPGDVLILTKPLGVGVISFASQIGRASQSAIDAAAKSMTELNKVAAETMLEVGVNAATDVTGFGLLGHLGEMVAQSGVTAEIYADKVPVFDEVLDYISQGMISGGVERNLEHASQRVRVGDEVGDDVVHLLYDPQTSGGLLMAVPQEKTDTMIERLRDRGVVNASVVGRIIEESDGRILIRNSGENSTVIAHKEISTMAEETMDCCCSPGAGSECCSPQTGTDGGSASPTEAKRKFADFMREVNSEGAISVRTKELMAIALSILSKCEPCVKIHIDKARSMGVSDAEINEAVWMGIAFGGAPTMMFYSSITEEKK